MKANFFNSIFKLALLLMAILILSTCNSSKEVASSSTSFKIPKKIVKAEDLPPQMLSQEQGQAKDQQPNQVHYVQLFPDEKTSAEILTASTDVKPEEEKITDAVKTAPEQGKVIIPNEMTEIEKHVDDVVKNMVQNRTRPIYFHIVSGSFKNKLYADKFAGYLKNIGYGNTYVRSFDNGFNRVIVQRYNNEVEARQYLQGYRNDNPLYADAWLYYNKDYSENEPTAFLSN